MKIIYRNVRSQDLNTIVELESAAFKMSKEMTERDMIGRIKNYPDTFLVAEDQDNHKLVGYTFGPAFSERYIKDEIYFKNHPNRATDQYQMILSIVVNPAYRHHKIGSCLLKKMEQVARKQGRKAISLTCKTELIPFYQLNGFKNEGEVSDDIPVPEGKTDYNMVKEL